MRGEIVNFSMKNDQGLISGEDLKRYRFKMAEWQDELNPEVGMAVDFDINIAEGCAVEIYSIRSRSDRHKETEELDTPERVLDEPIEDEWRTSKEAGFKENKRVFFGFLVLAIIALLIRVNSLNSQSQSWSKDQKVKLCKAYIGSMFAKPVEAIHYREADSANFITVEYVRNSDRTIWINACDFVNGGNSMEWRAYQSLYNEWGRWRTEDRVSINYNEQSNVASFVSPDTNELIKVKF